MKQALFRVLICFSVYSAFAVIIHYIKSSPNEVIMLREYMCVIFASLAYIVNKLD